MININKIGFGIMLGCLLTMVILTIFFGNGKEVLCVLPILILGYSLYELNQNKDE